MKEIRYLSGAREDLRGILNYYESLAPDVAARVLADIEHAIAYLPENPYLGAATMRRGVRGKLSKRYHFKITYRVRRNCIEIVGVFRFKNRTA